MVHFCSNYLQPASRSKTSYHLPVMKFTSAVISLLAIALPILAVTESLSYDTTYDNPDLALTSVACSDGTNGLITKGYTTLGQLPTYPNVGGVYTVTGWNSAACGTCYEVTYGTTTIAVLAVDTASEGLNLSEEAMNTLTGNQAVFLGRVSVDVVATNASACGL
ncbi:Cerato-platanin [Suillus paluster]|uniref:Cerato-platanin n=1 Tax=Suillus paluster TaxID=48578 RepID=UPI001B872DF2|nr:Cerato-platanin [Suillus paluster]KAG1736917.1 Cerato-platanin [Suillus paluster]